jgi:predicted CoA-substrate-specific enzyme activase
MIVAGIDAGHVNTKAVLVRGTELVGFSVVPTRFNPATASERVMVEAMAIAGVSSNQVAALGLTGIFRDLVVPSGLKTVRNLPDYEADARGASFLDADSRTVIDMGGNIHKAISYDRDGRLVDVVQNDKCADGLGIFHASMARILGVNEEEVGALASQSTRQLALAIQCSLSAEADGLDLLCRGLERADVAKSALGFIVDRAATLCLSFTLHKNIVVAGGLAKSRLILEMLGSALNQEIKALQTPEYVGAIGAAVSCRDSNE